MLEAPETSYAPKVTAGTRGAAGPRDGAAGKREPGAKAPVRRRVAEAAGPQLRRDLTDDYARAQTESAARPRTMRFTGLRFRLRGGVPKSVTGRVVAGAVALACVVGFTAVVWEARSYLLHDPRLVVTSSSAIQITGNSHLTRPQLLSIFGEDVDRNLLTVPLAERRVELEQLPWVQHAAVMRLLPNRIRVAIVERTPVAFVREGGHIGLVDASGVLMDISPDAMESDRLDKDGAAQAQAASRYSFPVVTGVQASDPLSTRAARMELYQRFLADLDAGKEKLSTTLSEVDLTSPEDVKALIATGGAEILVHFGDDDFLERYQRFQQRLPEWRAQYPKLASVDMRYERQVVLEMAPGSAVPAAADEAATAKASAPVAAAKPAAKSGVKPTAKKVAVKPVKPVAKAVPVPPAGGHLQTAFDVHAKPGTAARPKTSSQAGPQ